MADRKLPQNSQPVNRLALKWLNKAKVPPEPWYLHLLVLASWGLENKAEGDWPESHKDALKDQVNLLFGWKPADVMEWVFENPNGPSRLEQRVDLAKSLSQASNPENAAAFVLNAIYSRQVSQCPALQPAASELS
jgi:hypothetical protein